MRAMNEYKSIPQHTKPRKRRRVERNPIAGWLLPEAELQGHTAWVSQDLVKDLLGYDGAFKGDGQARSCSFVAVAPWTPLPLNSLEDDWTILPVRPEETQEKPVSDQRPSTVHLPAATPSFHSLVQALRTSPFTKSNATDNKGFEINILDVEPLSLETVYVTVNGDALDKHEEVQRQFGGGFLGGQAHEYSGKAKKPTRATKQDNILGSDRSSKAQDEALTSAIRQALASCIITRQGDLLQLPLPAHPITHVPFPPAHITWCEPVKQGLPIRTTKIVVNRLHHTTKDEPPPAEKPLPVLSSSKSLTDFDFTDGDATSAESFHSAVENGDTSDNDEVEAASELDELDRDSNDSSSDSSEDLITMAMPSLATRPTSGIMSSNTAATPRPYSRANGASTPGSIFSTMTSATARQGQMSKGRIFRAQGLLRKIPDELLQPSPAVDEDEECRVFVDMKVLVRLGCFSGDWVKLLPEGIGEKKHIVPLGQQEYFRPAKIYGLADLQLASMARSAGGMPQTRRSSVAPSFGRYQSSLIAWLSPILLANIGQPESIRISPLLDVSPQRPTSRSRSGRRKMDSSAAPPVADEMTLVKVPTPLSTERAAQAGMFIALKHHFEQKQRVVQKGDLVALPMDVLSSRMLSSTGQGYEAEKDVEDLLALPPSSSGAEALSTGVAWFKIGSILRPEPSEAPDLILNVWGGAATIEPGITRTSQTGSEQGKIPPLSTSTWDCYLGMRNQAHSSWALTSLFLTAAPKPHISGIRRRLRGLMAAATSSRAINLGMDPLVVLLHSTHRNIGKMALATGAASDLGIHSFDMDAYDLLAEGNGGGDVKSEAMFQARVERGLTCGAQYTSLLLRHVEALTAERMVFAMKETVKNIRVLVMTTTKLDDLPEGLRSFVTHELEVAAPDEDERRGLLRDIIQQRGLRTAHDVDLAAVAIKTAALVAGNLVDIVERAIIARQDRLEKIVSDGTPPQKGSSARLVRDVLVAGGETIRCLTMADFDIAVEAARKNFADAIGAPKIPNVSWDDVGGLGNVKDAVIETIQLPLERPELFAKGMKKRSGILFYGPPGTGKTLLAKAIATEFSLNFFSIKGPELLNMYIGESEANVRRIFQRARDARPCVVFFDELDSVAPKRGNQGDSGGVMDRIVSQLLAELDGMSDGDEGGGGVFVIGATNRPDLLDQALLRPGRFDKMLYLGVSDTHEKQNTILEALTRKFSLHPDLSLRHVADQLPFTYTGADLYALCSDAMLKAITRQASAVDAKIKELPGGPVTTAYFFDHLASEEDIAVMVTEEDFAAAKRELVPSVR